MSDNLKWMLGGEPPEPQHWEDAPAPEEDAEVLPSETHTGTDPNGRAVGPLEDHTEPKKVMNADGEIVTPEAPEKPKGRRSSKAKSD